VMFSAKFRLYPSHARTPYTHAHTQTFTHTHNGIARQSWARRRSRQAIGGARDWQAERIPVRIMHEFESARTPV
ncbi:MAG: hypothetical protein ACK55Z_37680, partial [bacterium]